MMTKYKTSVHKGKGFIVRVHKPILTEEENNKRIENVKESLVNFAKETKIWSY